MKRPLFPRVDQPPPNRGNPKHWNAVVVALVVVMVVIVVSCVLLAATVAFQVEMRKAH